MRGLTEEGYVLCSPEQAASALGDADVIGVDTETTSLSPMDGQVRLLQLSSGEGAYIIDVFEHPDLSPVKALLEGGALKVIHNAKFDIAFLAHRHGIWMEPVFDSMLAARLMDAPSAKLGNVVLDYLDLYMDKEAGASDWTASLSEEQIRYAGKDAEILVPLQREMQDKLEAMALDRVAEVEFGAVGAVAAMELAGFGIDLIAVEKMRRVTVARRLEAALAFESYLPYKEEAQLGLDLALDPQPTMNLNSPYQVKAAFASLGIDLPGTAVGIMKTIDHDAARTLLEHRKHTKRLSYLEKYPQHVRKDTGRIHAQFNQLATDSGGAKTGRFSCSDPNLQQVPREQEFRSLFVADKGNVLITADYSQIELRILAELTKDKELTRIFKKDADLHSATYAVMFGVPTESVEKSQRDIGKKINFSLLYGQGPGGLASTMGVTKERAEELIGRYFAGFKGFSDWKDRTQVAGDRRGFIRTLSGRRVELSKYSGDPDNLWRDRGLRQREAVNYQIQGTSADITKRALALLHQTFREEWNARPMIVNCVHDEIVVEAPEEWGEEVAEVVKDKMKEAGEEFLKSIPVDVDAEVAKEWRK